MVRDAHGGGGALALFARAVLALFSQSVSQTKYLPTN